VGEWEVRVVCEQSARIALHWSISDVLSICAQVDLRCLGEQMHEGFVLERESPHFWLGHDCESVGLLWKFGSSRRKHILRVHDDCRFQCSPCVATLNMSHYHHLVSICLLSQVQK
jgi:hypothetical protein